MAPSVTVEMAMKQAVMEEAAQVNKKNAVGLTQEFLNDSLMSVRCKELVVGYQLSSWRHTGRPTGSWWAWMSFLAHVQWCLLIRKWAQACGMKQGKQPPIIGQDIPANSFVQHKLTACHLMSIKSHLDHNLINEHSHIMQCSWESYSSIIKCLLKLVFFFFFFF